MLIRVSLRSDAYTRIHSPKCGNAMKATVQSACPDSVFKAIDIVMFAEAQIRTKLKMNATPKKYSNFFPPMYSAQSTRFVTIGYLLND